MRFVIIASRRTGSSHLVNMLSGHPEIFCHGNVFEIKMMPVFWPKAERPDAEKEKTIKAELRALRGSDPQAFLEHIFSLGYGRPNVGFKIFRGQEDEVLHRMIQDRGVRKVVLFRGNILANYSSTLAAATTGKWGAKKGESTSETPKVEFDEKGFTKFHDKYLQFYRTVIEQLNAGGERFHFVNYEEINDPLLLASLANFLGADVSQKISKSSQRKKQIKQNSSDILSRFSNAGYINAFLKERGLLHWSHEGETSLELMGRKFTDTSVSEANSD